MATCLQNEDKCFEMGRGCYVFNFHGCCRGTGRTGEGCDCDPERLDRIEQGLQDLRDKVADLEEKVENCDCCNCGENPDDPEKPGPGIINVVRDGTLIHSWPAGSDASVAIWSKDYAQPGDTIYIGEGTFECATELYRYSTGVVTHLIQPEVEVVGVPGKTVVVVRQDLAAAPMRDNAGLFNMFLDESKPHNGTIRNIIYDYRMAPKSNNYSNTIFTGISGLKLHNCVMKCSGSDNISLGYFSRDQIKIDAALNDCTILSDMEPVHSHSGIDGSVLNGCAYNKNLATLASGETGGSAMVTASHSNLDFDPATYRITSDDSLNAVCGVYSGPNAWPWP